MIVLTRPVIRHTAGQDLGRYAVCESGPQEANYYSVASVGDVRKRKCQHGSWDGVKRGEDLGHFVVERRVGGTGESSATNLS